MRVLRGILSAVLTIQSCLAQLPLLGVGPAISPTGAAWTLIQHPHNYTCSYSSAAPTTLHCAVTATATTAGNLLIFLSSVFQNGTGISALLTSSASGDSTWTHCSVCYFPEQYETKEWEIVDAWYILSATGGATSFTFSWNILLDECNGAGGCFVDAELLEVHRSTGTATFDAGNANGSGATGSADCTSCVGPALTLSGTSDYIAQWMGYGGDSIVGISGAAYTNPIDIDNTNVFGAFAGALNQSSGAAQTWTGTASGASGAGMGAIAFK